MKREKPQKTCYLCGCILIKSTKNRKGNASKEHVPPQGLFPDHLKQQLITVPCCEPCNNGHADTDELLLLLAGSAWNGMKAMEIREKVLKSVRGEGGLRKHMPYILKSRVTDSSGTDWIKWPPHMRETIPRMAKGLLYKFYGVRDFSQDSFRICVMSEGMRDSLLAECTPQSIHRIERGSGVFRADIVVETDARQVALLWLQFFQGATYYVLYLTPNPVYRAP